MRLLILYPIVWLLFCNSCVNTKIVKNSENGQSSKSESIQMISYEFKNCESSNTCVGLFDCYHTYLKSNQLFDYETQIEARKFFNLDSLLNCTLFLYENDIERKELAEECLFTFFNTLHKDGKLKNRKTIPTRGLLHNILKNWNSKKSFDVSMILSSVNFHDSMGHGDCTNLSVDFINTIVLPKIKSINNKDPDQFYIDLVKHLDTEQNYANCFDSIYNIVYPELKKAWEDGKIVLKTDQVKIDK